MRKDGRLVTVETSGMPVFAEDGSFRGYTGVDRDVTSRKQAEQALRESEERFRKVFEEGPIGMVLTSRDFGFCSANPAFCRMWGYTPEEMNGLTFLDVNAPGASCGRPGECREAMAGRDPDLPDGEALRRPEWRHPLGEPVGLPDPGPRGPATRSRHRGGHYGMQAGRGTITPQRGRSQPGAGGGADGKLAVGRPVQ